MTAAQPKSPGARLLAVAAGDRFLTREVAEILHVSVSTVRKLNATHRDTLGASDIGRDGDRVIWLYTPEDVQRLRRYFISITATARSGAARRRRRWRPSLWTDEERAARNRGYMRIYYNRRRAAALEGTDPARAARHRDLAEQIKAGLVADAEQRKRAAQAAVRPPAGPRTLPVTPSA